MTPSDLRRIRNGLGLSQAQFARALGYANTKDNRASGSVNVRRYETGLRPIPVGIERLALMFKWHGVPEDWVR